MTNETSDNIFIGDKKFCPNYTKNQNNMLDKKAVLTREKFRSI